MKSLEFLILQVTEMGLNLAEKEGKKEEEETTFEGEFIKVEKETLESKDAAHAATENTASPNVVSLSSASREFLESQEKVRELEVELERVTGSLKDSESRNAQLNDELSLTKEKLGEVGKKYEELEVNHKKLQQQIAEEEGRYSSQLSALQDAIDAREVKHKELESVKEAFERLSLEFDSSKKKREELEQELQASVGESRKFEELHKQSGSLAESETERALEFERLLELSKLSAKEMEDQMASLQAELKVLYEKTAEGERVEEALKCTSSDLSRVQGELDASKLEVQDMAEKLASKDVILNELNQELDTRKASESQLKEDMLSVEKQYSSAKEDLQSKIMELESFKLKLEEEINTKEKVEAKLRSQEEHFAKMVDELGKLSKEKEALEDAISDLTKNAAEMKELCSDLEAKLRNSDENFCKADTLLSQALANSAELEQKLKTLEELQFESGHATTTANQKNVELEDLLQASYAAAEHAKAQLVESESRFIAAEQRNLELEQKLNLVELKSSDAEREVREMSEKIFELHATLEKVMEEKNHLNAEVQEFQDKISKVESDSNEVAACNSELEQKLKSALEKCAEHEDRVNITDQRSRELEDLMQISHSKAEDASKKVSELELLLETEKYRIQELEEQISALEKKCEDAEAESNQYCNKVSELEEELKAFQSKALGFETALQSATEKEKELSECLNVTTEDKRTLEDAYRNSTERLAESENLLEVLRNELNVTQQRLESIECDLTAAGLREGEVMEKLKSAEEQLEKQGKVLEQATARSLELESLHETLARDSELKLQEAAVKFSSRDSEAQSLYDKIKTLEDQVRTYEEQITEATERSEAVKHELEQVLLKLSLSENTTEDFKKIISETEGRAAEVMSENELLTETNIQLKKRINDLEELLNSASTDKEATIQQLDSHMNTITELADKHARASEMQLAAESRISETETKLEEAIQNVAKKDLEAKHLMEKLNSLQDQVKAYEEQAHDTSSLAESLKVRLEQTLSTLRDQEGTTEELKSKSIDLEEERARLLEVNSELTEKLASYEPKVIDLETKLEAAFVERNEAVDELQASKTVVANLTQDINSGRQKLQLQVSSLVLTTKHQCVSLPSLTCLGLFHLNV